MYYVANACSNRNLCNWRVNSRNAPDDALGPRKDEVTPVYVLAYGGQRVNASIGTRFSQLLHGLDIDASTSPVVSATKASAAVACGQPRPSGKGGRAVRLAEAVSNFHFPSGFQDVKAALECVHELILELEGHLTNTSYHQYVADNEIEPMGWRPDVTRILQELRFDPGKLSDAKAWHTEAKNVFPRHVSVSPGQSISQLLRWNAAISTAMAAVTNDAVTPRTIHSVKGMEFPAVCVVTTRSTLKAILDFLECGIPAERAEEARKLYVAASRAQQLLVVAAPQSQADRLACHLRGQGASVKIDRE